MLYYTNPLTQWHLNLKYLCINVLREVSFNIGKRQCSGEEFGDVFILSEGKHLLQYFMLLLTTYQLVIIFKC